MKGTRKQTEGVQISEIKFSDVIVSMWDFAGQTNYYSTHQFFFSAKAIHLLVFKMHELDVIKSNSLLEWLSSIQVIFQRNFMKKFQARVPGAQVALVGTFLDKISSNQIWEISSEITKALETWFTAHSKDGVSLIQFIRNPHSSEERPLTFFPISNTTNAGVEELKQVLLSSSQGAIVDFHIAKLKSLIERERDRSDRPPIMKVADLQAMVEQVYNVEKATDELMYQVRNTLVEIGACMDFCDQIPNLDLIIIDPKWLSELLKILVKEENQVLDSTR